MDPRAVAHPVGPLPPSVYWTRRLLLIGAVLVIVIAVAVSCAGGSSGPKRPAANPTGSPSPSASSTSGGSPSRCTPAQLTITASTDASSYAAGTLPRLHLAVRNTGTTTCVFVDGPSLRTWTIVSGSDTVWTTAGCNASKRLARTTLAVGESARHTIVWNRHRSDKNCATSTTEATPGTYQLTVAVDGTTSAPAVFHLTA